MDEVKDLSQPETTGATVVTRISNLLSWVLVPLMMPVYAIMLVFGITYLNAAPFMTKVSFILTTLCINCFIPMLLVVLLKKLGLVEDLGLNGRKERMIPYVITVLCLCATAWFFATKRAPEWVWLFFLGGAAGAIVNFCVNFKWKISAHAAGIAGLVALLLYVCRTTVPNDTAFVWLLVMIALAGLLGSARVWLGRHTVMQVICGYAVGFTTVYLSLILFA